MKKLFLFALMALSFGAVQAQEGKEELKAPLSDTDQTLQLAIQLSRYGYANKSALSLVEAAKIVAANGFTEGDRQPEDGHTDAPDTDEKKAQTYSLDATKLLEDALTFAGNDKNLKKVIENAQKEITEASRGRVGGPGYDVSTVSAHSSVTYRMSFRAGELASVVVIGDGDTDLDLYVYDQYDNLIASDTDYTDNCVCQWYPRWTGQYRIVIRNRGSVYNRYVIRTN